ncbi:MAG: ABC transporter ATP-binding protein [Bacteroidales bacterium]|nr:ABC transporter ATP-binding protein [Bacteroidales bacterium]
MRQNIVIQAEHLYKRFGKFTANDDLNFSVREGEIFGFLGANGAGKTTAIKILCGLSKPTSGIIKVAGYDVYTQTEFIKRNIGYMSQKFSLYNDLTITENIRFYGGIYGLSLHAIKSRTEELLKQFSLIPYRNSLIKDLPLGWRQKLAFSIAIMHSPKIVFLDEPTSGVDPAIRRQFWELIYEASSKGITVFVTTHYMDEAEYCHRVTIMHEGKIVAIDSPKRLKEKFDSDDIYGVFLKLVIK